MNTTLSVSTVWALWRGSESPSREACGYLRGHRQGGMHSVLLGSLAVILTTTLMPVHAEVGTASDEPASRPRLEPRSVSLQADMAQQIPMGIDLSLPSSGAAGAPVKDEWVYAPVPGYNPVLGATLLLGAAKIYHPKSCAPTAPAWMTGGGAFVAENGSWAVGAGHKMNLQDDQWRIKAGLAYADINYRYYGIGNEAGDQEYYVPLRQQAPAIVVKVMGRVSPSWYLGLKIMAADTTVRLNPDELPPEIQLPPEWQDPENALKAFLAAVTPTLEYDSRDDDFFPRHGVLFSAEAALFSERFGSDFNFQTYTIAYNQYFKVGARGVLAVRGYARVSAGDVPFFAMSSLGQGSDIRGYTAGRYRDEALVTAQAEYRYELSARWTLVGFAGLGGVGPSVGEIPQSLPAAGCGVRYSLGKENKVNLRLDLAWGRDDQAFYLAVGEAF